MYKFAKHDIIEETGRKLVLGRMWIKFHDAKLKRDLWTVLSDRKGDQVAKFVRVPPGSKYSRRTAGGGGGGGAAAALDRNSTFRGLSTQQALAQNEITPEEYAQMQAVLEQARLIEAETAR